MKTFYKISLFPRHLYTSNKDVCETALPDAAPGLEAQSKADAVEGGQVHSQMPASHSLVHASIEGGRRLPEWQLDGSHSYDPP